MSIGRLISKSYERILQNVGMLAGRQRVPPVRGTRQILEAYKNLPWLRATTNKISRSVADTTWRVYAIRQNGKAIKNTRLQKSAVQQRTELIKHYRVTGELEEIVEHPLIDVLYGGNDYILGITNIQLFQIYIDLVGEAYFFKERDEMGIVKSLWPIPPHWITETPLVDQPYFKLSYNGLLADIPIHDIVWLIDPNPARPYERGTGGARALADELETDEYSAKYTKSFFYNSARPDLIISGDDLNKENTKRLEQNWLEKNQGITKSFKPFFISKSVQIKEISQNFQHMQLNELRKFERDSIHQFWGIPPEILGIVEKSNRATIDGADYIYNKHVITPRVELLRSVLQERLVPEFDERIILDYDSPVQEDKAHKLEVYRSAPHMFTQEQWQNLAGNDAGEAIYAVPFNLVFTDTLNGQSGTELPEDKSLVKKNIKQLTPEQIALISNVVAGIKFNSMSLRVEPEFKEIVSHFGAVQADLIGITYQPESPRVQQFIDDRIGKEIKGITETTRKAIAAELSEGLINGESMNDLGSRVKKYFQTGRRNRARTIARTESVVAANYGHLSGMEQGGIDKKMWISSRDERVRETHSIGPNLLDGQTVGINEDFVSVSGASGPFPGLMSTAAESVNCRCIIVSVLNNRDYDETFKKSYWKTFEADRMPYEKRLINLARDGFTEQEHDAIKTLREQYNV